MHYTRFGSTIPCHGRPWVEHGVTTECSTIRVIVRALQISHLQHKGYLRQNEGHFTLASPQPTPLQIQAKTKQQNGQILVWSSYINELLLTIQPFISVKEKLGEGRGQFAWVILPAINSTMNTSQNQYWILTLPMLRLLLS